MTSHRPPAVAPGIAFGCDYNPEQWSPEVWEEDVALMQQAGVDLVAVNIFGWSHIEPRSGVFDFDRLDRVIELLHAAGIGVNLGTGTASTPAWLSRAHPEVLPMLEDGTRRYPGGRQAWCPSSPVFREHALRLATAVAERYGSHPAVRVWHVSNEIGCHNALCYCEESAAAFRRWLRERYADIDAVNEAWGTAFWSQSYREWDEILPPLATISSRNPAQVLDFHRFSSDELLAYYRAEAAAVRVHSTLPITTNFMVTAHIQDLDYWSWAGDVDIVANDHYLDHRLADPLSELAFSADLTRGVAQGQPWLLMEHSTGAVNWQPVNLTKEPGQMARNTLGHIARGADGACFFQWRASVQGGEKYHSAMLPHVGTDSAMWAEVVALGGMLDRLDEVAGSRVQASAALVFSWESWWAAGGDTRPSQAVTYLDQVHAAYSASRAAGLTVDMVAPGAALDSYDLVIVPALHLLREQEAAVIDAWVSRGGTALVTFLSGTVDQDDRVWTGGYTGPLRDMLGVHIEEFAPLLPGAALALSDGSSSTLWSERGRVTTAEAIASFVDGPAAGSPALTRNTHGAGEAWYLATQLGAADYLALIRRLADAAGVTPPAVASGAPGDVDLVRRVGDDASYLFVINHGAAELRVGASGVDLLTGESFSDDCAVAAGAIRVLREERPTAPASV